MRKLFIFVLTLFLQGCGESIETSILGSWKGSVPPQNLHFEAGGDVLLEDRKLNRTYHGSYSINGSTLEMKFKSFQRPVIRDADISGNTLTLSRDGGPPEVLQR